MNYKKYANSLSLISLLCYINSHKLNDNKDRDFMILTPSEDIKLARKLSRDNRLIIHILSSDSSLHEINEDRYLILPGSKVLLIKSIGYIHQMYMESSVILASVRKDEVMIDTHDGESYRFFIKENN